MTKNEAIEILKAVDCSDCATKYGETDCNNCAVYVAIGCIEKRKPKRPTHINYFTIEGGYDICPDCGTLIIDSYRYCHGCGQKIDRGENE